MIVEGRNDVIALEVLDVPAVGLCSNTVTGEQVEKISQLAQAFGGGVVTLMLDCDAEGENGREASFGRDCPDLCRPAGVVFGYARRCLQGSPARIAAL